MSIPSIALNKIVRLALEEDLANADITTDACVDETIAGKACLTARQPITFCGSAVFRQVFQEVDPQIRVSLCCQDAQRLNTGDIAAKVEGPASSILKGERVALNFVQRLSGIATLTRTYVVQLPKGSKTRITDTRKTTPGLRALERYAVRCGGASNHRYDLGSAILIKDNHIAACGGIRQAIQRVRNNAPHTSRITCEVDNIKQLKEALSENADIVMLDNFDDHTLNKAVEIVAGRALIEVSGNVCLEKVGKIAKKGVNVISIGRLTHSAMAVDLGLDWES